MAHQQNVPRLLVRRELTGQLFAIFSENETAALRAGDGTILVQELKKAIAKQWQEIGWSEPFGWECVQVLATQAAAQEMGAIPLPPVPEQTDPEEAGEADQSATVFRHFCADIERIPLNHFEEDEVGVSFGVKLFTPFTSREQLDDACRTALLSMLPDADAAARQAMEEVESLRGPLRIWDVSAVADLSSLFRVFSDDIYERYPEDCVDFLFRDAPGGFDADLSGWKTTGVTSMASMFCGCSSFTGTGLASWDVGSVTTFENMFAGCHEFAARLDCWSTSSCENMRGMFQETCFPIGHGLRGWDCTSCTDMSDMFSDCMLRGEIPSAIAFSFKNTGRVVSMRGMFARLELDTEDEDHVASLLSSLSDWDISRLESAAGMFEGRTEDEFDADVMQHLREKGWKTDEMFDAGNSASDGGEEDGSEEGEQESSAGSASDSSDEDGSEEGEQEGSAGIDAGAETGQGHREAGAGVDDVAGNDS
eukprot:g1846.t1